MSDSSDVEETSWWESITSITVSLPIQVIERIQQLTGYRRSTTLKLLYECKTPKSLLNIITDRIEHIQINRILLAHITIIASHFLLSEIYQTIQKIEADLLSTRLSGRIYYRLQNNQIKLKQIRNVLLQFTGNHIQTIDHIRIALKFDQYVNNRIIIMVCRQITAFIHAVHESKNLTHLLTLITEIVTTSLHVNYNSYQNQNQRRRRRQQQQKQRQPYENTQIVLSPTEQLGQFLAHGPSSITNLNVNANANATITPSNPTAHNISNDANSIDENTNSNKNNNVNSNRISNKTTNNNINNNDNNTANTSMGLSSRDVDINLTLQILQNELTYISTIYRRVSSMIDEETSSFWEARKDPLKYIGLLGITLQTCKSVYLNSRYLGGSGALEDNIIQYSLILQTYFHNNVYTPILNLKNKIFTASAITSTDENALLENKESLNDMIIDFTHDGNQISMKNVMKVVQEQSKYPIRNLIKGHLGQAMIVQIQKVKCDVEELMLKTKYLLRTQELNLALVAVVPSLLTLTCLGYLFSVVISEWKARGKQVIVSGKQTAKLLLADIYTTLSSFNNKAIVGLSSSVEDELFKFNEENEDDDDDDEEEQQQPRSSSSNGLVSNNIENQIVVNSNSDDDIFNNNIIESNKFIDMSENEASLRKLKSLGMLHAKIFELEEIVVKNTVFIRMAPKIRLRFTDDLNMLRNCLIPFEDRKNHVIRMFLCYQFLHD